jgi:hypothetical protein
METSVVRSGPVKGRVTGYGRVAFGGPTRVRYTTDDGRG